MYVLMELQVGVGFLAQYMIKPLLGFYISMVTLLDTKMLMIIVYILNALL